MPSRPVVGIASTMIARYSNLASTILRYVTDRQKNSLETKSRENLQAVFTQANSRLRKEAIQKKKDTLEQNKCEKSDKVEIEQPSKYINNGPLVVMSMDVVSLYPSITAEHAGRRVREAIEKTDVSFDADYKQALRYLARNANDQQLDAWGFGKYVPRRTKNKGTRPGMADTKKDR